MFHVPPTAMVAFRPQRLAGAAVRVHPRVCRLEVCKQSGASFNPFLGSSKEWPEQPAEIDWDEWQMYSDELVAAFHQQADFDDNDLGPLALLALSGARGNQQQLIQYVGGGLIYREDGSLFAQRSPA